MDDVTVGGRYFRIPNFVCKRKEMSMTQLNILENHGFFIVLLYFYTVPSSNLDFSSVITLLSEPFAQCSEAFYDGKFVVGFFKLNKNVNVCCFCVGINWQSLVVDKRVF